MVDIKQHAALHRNVLPGAQFGGIRIIPLRESRATLYIGGRRGVQPYCFGLLHQFNQLKTDDVIGRHLRIREQCS